MKIHINEIKGHIVVIIEKEGKLVWGKKIETEYDLHTFMHLLRTEWMKSLEIAEMNDE